VRRVAGGRRVSVDHQGAGSERVVMRVSVSDSLLSSTSPDLMPET
jgi:hypothetical protein